jgi:penicillin-binding protein 1A
VWVTASICPESGLLANTFCPTKITKVLFKRPGPIPRGSKPLDAGFSLPASNCNIHGGQPADTNSEMIGICTDPRHNGKPVLANYPKKERQGDVQRSILNLGHFHLALLRQSTVIYQTIR